MGHFKVGPIDYEFILKYEEKSIDGLNQTAVRFFFHLASKRNVA